MAKITFISNDTVNKVGLIGEHGNSILVENDYGKVLFDTGQGLAIENNINQLNIDLSDLTSIAISHGHNDHIGGIANLKNVLNQNNLIDVYCHPRIFDERKKLIDNHEVNIGSPYGKEDIEKLNFNVKTVTDTTEISKNVFLSGYIPRRYEETGSLEHYRIINGRKTFDDFEDDQNLIVKSDKGISIIFGCAHAGVINTIEYVCNFFKVESIYGLFGGTHLLNKDRKYLEKLLKVIIKKDVQVIGFNHCTGDEAIEFFKSNFPGIFIDASTGNSIIV